MRRRSRRQSSGIRNGNVVTVCIILSILFWGGLGWKLGWVWLMFASIILGPLTGVVVGFLLLHFLLDA